MVTTNISVDTTWTTNDSPVLVTPYNFVVDTNATLTIDPGVTVRLTGTFTVRGQIRALGTPAKPIYLEGTNSSSTWGYFKFEQGSGNYLKTNLISYAVLTNLGSYIYASSAEFVGKI